MDHALTDIKIEPIDSTSSHKVEISIDRESNSDNHKSDYLIKSKVYVKTEFQEDESEFLVSAGTSNGMDLGDDIKYEMYEPMIKIECEDEIMQDPLDFGSEIKVEVPTCNSDSEKNYKSGQAKKEIANGDFLLTSDDEKSYASGTSNKQNQLLVQNKNVPKHKKYICHICNKAFLKKGDFNRHLLIHSGVKPFKCEICKNTFTQKGHLDTHMLIHSGEKAHICDICKKVFSQKSNLNNHILIHSGNRPFSCKVCDKSFTHKQALARHRRIHTGDKPYICDLCNKSFAQKTHLIQHGRTHTGERPYSCDICYKSFAYKTNLNYHIRTHKP